jgi:hypothetical protein
VTKFEFTEEEIFAIGDALDAAAKRTAEELKLSRAKPYVRALVAEQKRYEALHARFVTEVQAHDRP